MQDFDLIVIGAGVAGLTAAMHGSRYGLKTAVIDRMGAGGQITTAERIDNFPGFPQGIAGVEFGPLLHEQAEAAGAEIMLDTVESLTLDGKKRIVTCSGETLQAPAVIIAAGSALRPLGVPGEEKLTGKGVSHCASCDAPFFKGQEACVIGGGDSAVEEALVVAAHAAKVTIFHHGPALTAQKILRDRAAATKNIDVVGDTTVAEITGDSAVTSVTLKDKAGVPRVHKISGVFVFVGLEPNTAFLNGIVKLDNAGHIETDIMMRSSVEGIFAAGDIRRHSVAQLAAVAGDGATAAVSAYRYLTGGA